MSKFLKLFIFALSLFVVSCDKDDDPAVPYLKIDDAEKVQLAKASSSQLTIKVQSNVKYKAESSQTWCEASIGDGVIVLFIDENKSDDGREAKITLSAPDVKPVEITIKQGGIAPYIILNTDSINVGDYELGFSIDVETNVEIEFEVPSWIKQSMASKGETKTYSFAVEPTTVERKGKVIVKGTGENSKLTAEFKVVQGAADPNDAPRFAVISDTHIKPNSKEAIDKVTKTLKLLIDKKPDAIFVVGDVTDYGIEQEYINVVETFKIVPASIPVYYMMGNHDRYQDSDGARFAKYFKQDQNQYVEIKGHPFITISQESTGGSTTYQETTKKFLSEKLEYAADKFPNKPIFVFYHTPLENTCYGSEKGDGWGSNLLESIINKYPQIIAFSGHSHFPLGDERSINQNVITAVNLGSQTYSELEPKYGFSEGIHPPKNDEVTEGIMVIPVDNPELKEKGEYSKNFKIQRLDTYRDLEIKEPWLILAPHNGTNYPYKNRTGSIPVFNTSAKVTVSKITDSECFVEWDQAQPINSYDKVHHYEVYAVENGNLGTPARVFSQFYLNTDMPKKLSWTMNGLKSETKYKIEVRAIDSWYTNKSKPIFSNDFTTTAYEVPSGVVAPVADVFDVAYTTAGAVNFSPMALKLTTGENTPKISYNPTLKMFMSTYAGNNKSFHKLDFKDNDEFKNKFNKKFTLEVFYKTEDTREVSPVSCMESGGIGIEQINGGGATRLWVDLGSGYLKVGTTVTNNSDYYHMVFTYDGSTINAYTNGVPSGDIKATGQIKFPSNTDAQWFGFGGDSNPSGNTQGALKGDVVFARLYGNSVSRDEAVRLYEQIGARAKMTKVGDLNTALTVTLPTKGNEALLKEGWKLMSSLTTTDAHITNFLEKVNKL